MLGSKTEHHRQHPLPQPQRSFRLIKPDDKFFSRLLSKETSLSNPSFRIYYGGKPGSVPFTWETRPGTPKHALCDNSVPPLSPPPSYYYTGSCSNNRLAAGTNTKGNRFGSNPFRVLHFLRKPKNGGKVDSSSPSDFSSSILSTSSSSSSLVLLYDSSKHRGGDQGGRRFPSQGSMSFRSAFDDEEGKPNGSPSSPTSTLCFGSKKWSCLGNVGRCLI